MRLRQRVKQYDISKDRRNGKIGKHKIAPLSLELPVVSPRIKENIRKDVSSQEIEAMTWLVGFWIGNGHESAPSFTLADDADVNNRFDESAKMWGMKSIPRNGLKNKVTLVNDAKQCGHNPLSTLLRLLGLYEKNVPIFMRTEQLLVREAFLAGLIDAMGYPVMNFTFIGVRLVTMYTPIKEAILFLAEPLALNVSSSHEAAGGRLERYLHNDNWILHISPGDNQEIF